MVNRGVSCRGDVLASVCNCVCSMLEKRSGNRDAVTSWMVAGPRHVPLPRSGRRHQRTRRLHHHPPSHPPPPSPPHIVAAANPAEALLLHRSPCLATPSVGLSAPSGPRCRACTLQLTDDRGSAMQRFIEQLIPVSRPSSPASSLCSQLQGKLQLESTLDVAGEQAPSRVIASASPPNVLPRSVHISSPRASRASPRASRHFIHKRYRPPCQSGCRLFESSCSIFARLPSPRPWLAEYTSEHASGHLESITACSNAIPSSEALLSQQQPIRRLSFSCLATNNISSTCLLTTSWTSLRPL